jgi:hypothetical protein
LWGGGAMPEGNVWRYTGSNRWSHPLAVRAWGAFMVGISS